MHPLPAHLRRLTDTTYFAAGLGIFVLGGAIQLGLYFRLLRPALAASDVAGSRRWLMVAVAWQTVVLLASGVYVFLTARTHPGGVAWIAPAIGALLGTALPLQVAAAAALRAARR